MNTPFAVRMANDILEMQAELEMLRTENEELREYREKYLGLLDSSIAHSAQITAGILKLAMTPGVMDAISASNVEASNGK